MLTAFGDWILSAPDGCIYLVDTLEGAVSRIAATGSEFNSTVDNDEAMRDEWLMEGLIIGQASRGVFLKKGQCFGFNILPILGGSLEAGNIQPFDIVVYETIAGQTHQQVRHPPAG